MTRKKQFSIILLAIIITATFFNINSYSSEEKKNVLILGSYNAENEWEQSIIRGIKSNSKNISIKVDFLDSIYSESDKYNESFMTVLNLKYKDDDIDCILTIDDEALNFARENLFNEDSFMYKKSVVFVGINSYITLNEEERQYVTGLLEYQDNLFLLDVILKLNKDVENIYLLLNHSIYSDTVKENILGISEFTSRPININIIENYYYEAIEDKIKDIKDCDAIILCGIYKDTQDGEFMSSEDIIKKIKLKTKAPIYSKLKNYVEGGAIGGVINDGDKLGKTASIFLDRALNEKYSGIVTPAYNTFSTPIFNYKALRYYNINPLLLPKDSVIIDKGAFNLLVPKYLEIGIWAVLILLILITIMFLYMFISNNRRALKDKNLLRESIERDEIKTDFILTMSHELRTPLNIIINANKLLKLRVCSEQYDAKFFNKQMNLINKNSNRLLRLINNLIDVSKIESGHIDATFQNENIVDVIEDATMSVVDLAKSYSIEIIFDTQEEEIITAIDRSKIERIMLNLLSNSIKFTDSGGHIYVNVKKYVKIL